MSRSEYEHRVKVVHALWCALSHAVRVCGHKDIAHQLEQLREEFNERAEDFDNGVNGTAERRVSAESISS